MARSITVEGSLMPAAGVLKRGERETWADSVRLRGLIAKGHLILISEHFDDDEDAPEPADEPEQFPGDPVEPAKNASTQEWRDFFAKQIPDEQIPEDAGRDAIIAAWERYKQQVTEGNG